MWCSLHYRFYRFNLVLTSLCFVDDLCQRQARLFSLIVLVIKVCPKVHSGREIQPTDVCKANVLKSSYWKIWSNILTARWRASAWSDKQNKEQSADDPSVDLIRVKNMLNSTISMSYPDVVIACIEHKVSLEAFRAIEAALVKHDNNMKDYPGGWLITITANHSNYLVCDRANTQSVTVRKVVKLQLNYCNALVIKWIYNIVLFGGKNAGCSFFITFNWCMLSFLTLSPTAGFNDPGWEIPGPFCSRAMLICSIIWLGKRMLRCCSAGSVLRWHEVAPYSVSLICIVWSCFYVKLMQIN